MIANLTKQLITEEGEILHAYDDHLNFLTIGVGRLIDMRKGGGITQEESRYLLANDIKKRVADVEKALPFYAELNDARQAVLIGMAFQMGVDGLLKFKTTLALIKAGNYADAGEQMLKSLWAKQTPFRAERMANQMATGEWVFK